MFDLCLDGAGGGEIGGVKRLGSVKTASRFSSLSWSSMTGHESGFPMGLIAGGMLDGTVNVWDPAKLSDQGLMEQSHITSIERHANGPVGGIQFNPHPSSSHLLASGGSDGEVRAAAVWLCLMTCAVPHDLCFALLCFFFLFILLCISFANQGGSDLFRHATPRPAFLFRVGVCYVPREPRHPQRVCTRPSSKHHQAHVGDNPRLVEHAGRAHRGVVLQLRDVYNLGLEAEEAVVRAQGS